jgi:diguanylate cyclase (GGDEF)-like protein
VVWLVYLTVGVVASIAYAFSETVTAAGDSAATPVNDIISTAIGLGAVVAIFVGPRWHHARPLRAWTLLGAAAVVFLVGILVRPWAAAQTGIAAFAGDAFTVPGYLLMIAGLILLIRARGLERHAVADGLIVGVGAGLASFLLLAVPAASVPGRNLAVSILAAVYPLFDVALLLILLNLAFTTAVRQTSFRLLVAMMILLLIGDIAYAIIGVQGKLFSSPLMDVPFLLGFVCIGAAALHPSIVELSRGAPLPVQPWSWQRLLLIGPAVAAPLVLIPLVADRSRLDRIVLALGGAAIVFLLIFRAVSAVQGYARAQRRAEYQATHDQLTDLPNRTMISAEVDRMLAEQPARGSYVWVLYVDLDGFKLVNDSWGHAAGDQLITVVAGRLRETMPADAMVARVGGDEFVVACAGDRNDAAALAERVFDCFSDPLLMLAAEVVISASVGIAGVPTDRAANASAEALMREADTAMYQAKSEGPGNWTIFDPSMHERVKERVEIEYALRQAITQRELYLVYQPIVELQTGRIVGAEALSRWNHPVRGEVSPAVFIPVAEAAGLIGRFGRWVIDESMRQLAEWRRRGVVRDDFWLSVNVSPQQLRDSTLPAVLKEAMLRHGVPAHAVVLEITESVMIEPWTLIDRVLLDLRILGLRIVVDDFGTGYSALGYLRRHPVTGVKIDRAFVGGLGSSAEDEEIVRAVVAMSGAMGLTVVAEGVETRAQQDVLVGLGVVLGQGYLWTGPISPVEFGARWSAAASPVGGS